MFLSVKEGRQPPYEVATSLPGAPSVGWRTPRACGSLGHRLALSLFPKNHIYSKLNLRKFLSRLDFSWYGYSAKQKHATNKKWHWALDQYVSPKNNIKSCQKFMKVEEYRNETIKNYT